MPKRLSLFFILLFLVGIGSAQEKLNFIQVDKHSYDLFLQQKWTELINYSEIAREQGIEFFYLQARTGIAYYNMKKYRKAADCFLLAWENDQSFEWLQEYLYYSLINGGRFTEASKQAIKFTPQMQKKIAYSKSKLTRLALEGGYTFNPEFDQIKNRDLGSESNLGGDYGESFLLKNYHFESFDVSHQVMAGVVLNHNFTFINVNREEQVDWGARSSFPIKTYQFQYLFNPHFVLGKKLYVSPSISAVWGSSSVFVGSLQQNSERYYIEQGYSFSDFIFSASAWSHFGNISPGAEVNFANIYNRSFTQFSGWLTFYPFSNANFYISPRIYFKADKEEGFAFNTFGISGGVQLGNLHFYGQYLRGKMKNFVESSIIF